MFLLLIYRNQHHLIHVGLVFGLLFAAVDAFIDVIHIIMITHFMVYRIDLFPLMRAIRFTETFPDFRCLDPFDRLTSQILILDLFDHFQDILFLIQDEDRVFPCQKGIGRIQSDFLKIRKLVVSDGYRGLDCGSLVGSLFQNLRHPVQIMEMIRYDLGKN